MGGNNLAVKLTADVIDLQTKFALARAETNALSSEMNKLAKEAVTTVGPPTAETASRMQTLAVRMTEAKAAASQLNAEMRGAQATFGGIGGVVDDMSSKLSTAFKFAGVTATVEAVHMLKNALEELGGRAALMQSQSEILGVTVEQFQALSAVAQESGLENRAWMRVGEQMVALLQQARDHTGTAIEKLHDLGITQAQITSGTFGMNDAFAVLHARLTDSSTAEEEHNRLLADFGPRGAEAIKILKEYTGSQEQVAALMRILNGLDEESSQKATALYASLKRLEELVANTLTKALVEAVDDLKPFKEGIFEVVKAMDFFMPSATFVTHLADSFRSLASIPVAPALRTTIDTRELSESAGTATNVLEEFVAKRQSVAKIEQVVSKEELADFRANVEEFKSGTAERVAAIRTLATATEAYYGDDKVAQVKAVQRELIAAERQYREAQVKLAEEAARKLEDFGAFIEENDRYLEEQRRKGIEQEAAADAESAKGQIALARVQLEERKVALTEEVDAHQIAAAQKLTIMRELTRQENDLAIQELEREAADAANKPVELARINAEILVAKEKLNLDLEKLDADYSKEAAKQNKWMAEQWKGTVSEIESAESSMLNDLLTRRKSFAQSAQAFGAQLVTKEIADDLHAVTTRLLIRQSGIASEKALEQGGFLYHASQEWAATAATQASQEARTAATAAGNAARLASDSSAAAAGRAESAAIGGRQVLADAAKAFSGTYASVSEIPVVGWILAPAAAAAAYAAVAAYEGIASLDVGAWNVPGDMIARVHKGETVLPVPAAESYRAGAARAGVSAGGVVRSGETHVHVNMSAWDGRSVADMIGTPAGRAAIASAMADHYRRGGR